jgi:hypothetical protein
MTLTLHIDGARWRANQAAVLADTPGLVPVIKGNGYGFGRAYALGTLTHERLRDMAPPWIDAHYPAFRSLCRSAFADACVPSDLPFLNWYELVALRSVSPPAAS